MHIGITISRKAANMIVNKGGIETRVECATLAKSRETDCCGDVDNVEPHYLCVSKIM